MHGKPSYDLFITDCCHMVNTVDQNLSEANTLGFILQTSSLKELLCINIFKRLAPKILWKIQCDCQKRVGIFLISFLLLIELYLRLRRNG